MASVKLEHIYKVYTGGTKAVSDMTLDIKDGEFIVFVGPSGCGKSTTLRMVAGLEAISAGELYIGDQVVNDVEPKDRDIAMVFQNYALYPQMTVYENMAFGLQLRHTPTDVIQQKVMWAANILGLTEMLDRKPKAMSGGQRQRVALGRAILRDPKVMLLDEPLSNLDAKLRTSMRTEIAKLHQRLKTTFIYVTHDQTEAMTLGDRVVVMKKGTVQQFDTPKNLYEYPANKFVAGFIGTPQMNFFAGNVTRKGDKVSIKLDKSEKELVADFNYFVKVNPAYLDGEHPVTMGIRCEHLHIVNKETKETLPVKVNRFEELGSEALIYGEINLHDEDMMDKDSTIIIKVGVLPKGLEIGQTIQVGLDMDHTYFFDAETEESIVPRIPSVNMIEASVKGGKLAFLGNTVKLPGYLEGTEDLENGELAVPNDAFIFGKGDVTATVVTTEVIGETKLLHLKVGERLIFALADKDYADGTELKLGFDFSRLSLKDSAGKEVIVPIRKFDAYNANFFNYKTAMAMTGDNPKFEEEKIRRETAAAAKYDELIAQAHVDYQRDYDSTVPEEFKNIMNMEDEGAKKTAYKQLVTERRVKGNQILAEDKAEMNKALALLKVTRNDQLKALKEKHKADTAEAKKQVIELYTKLRIDEKQSFEDFIKVNKDREALRRRRDEYRMFTSTFTDQRANAMTEAVKGIDINYDNDVSKVKSTYKRGVNGAKQAFAEKKKFYGEQADPVGTLDRKYAKKYADLEKEKKNAVTLAGNVFIFGIGKYYFMSQPVISAKLIQGLGTRVFSKNFLLEVPHDAYVVSEDGIDGRVESIVNYGNISFAKVVYQDSLGNEQFAYVQFDKDLKEGDEIKLAFDITKCQITETGNNIRLY